MRTGPERKFTTNPRRAVPSAMRSTPTITANAAASCTYRSVLPAASGASPAATSRELIAVGPNPSCRDRPRRAYTTSGSIEA
jgi:hypothetical protein